MTRRLSSKEAVFLLVHVLIGTVGGFVVAFVAELVFGATLSAFGIRVVGSGLYNPLVWCTVAALGFFVNRRLQNRSACLVGIVAAVFFFLLMWWDVSSIKHSAFYRRLIQEQYQGHYWRYEFEQLLARDDRACGSSECLGKLLFTFPFFASVAYSIGAALGLKNKAAETKSVLTRNN